MPESAYDQMRRERCKWCAAGSDAGLVAGKRIHQLGASSTALKPCTAPSLEAWVEELAQENSEMARMLAEPPESALRITELEKRLEQAREALEILASRQCASACLEKFRPESTDIRYPDWRDRCAKHVAEVVLAALSAEPEAGK